MPILKEIGNFNFGDLTMRYLVNVNTNHSTIKVHKEEDKSCSEIFKQIIAEYAASDTNIKQIGENKNILKIGTTENSFWLLVHGSIESSEENIKAILLKELKLSNKFTYVKHC